MRRFVFGTDRTAYAQDAEFLKLVRAQWPEMGWWHQLSEMWLFVDPTDTVTPSALRDIARKAFPNIDLLVIQVKDGKGWAGFGPKRGSAGDMFTWIHEWWGRSD